MKNKKLKTTAKTTNVTAAKLQEVPFKSARALKEAQDQIRLLVWRRMEEAKVINDLLSQEGYKFWHEEFSHGLICSYVDEQDLRLVRVHSDGKGINISINKALAAATPIGESVLTQLVRAMSESFATTYYRAKGLLPQYEGAKASDSDA